MPLRAAGGVLRLGAYLLLSAPRPPRTDTVGLDARLAALPIAGAPIERPVEIRWNAHQVPFVVADSDRDLAVALGLVHAHLRLGQMEVLRRVAFGRLSELAGPVALDLDHALRIINFGRAVPDILAMLPRETRDWLDGFVSGINHYQAKTASLPHEFALFGLEREPWRVEDILTLGRLVGADITWLAWLQLMRLRASPDWSRIWTKLVDTGRGPGPDMAASDALGSAAIQTTLGVNNRAGSNCFAVSARRGNSGSAWLAGDPHLGLSLPNNWLIAGYKSPSYDAVGLMIPGLPFLAIGRNRWIAWGGTNLHAAASELVDISEIPDAALESRHETIRVRWADARERIVRAYGRSPVLSDSAFFRSADRKLALRWVGHTPSDEITAMLAVNRARSWEDFSTALEGFAVPGQNMIYADATGEVGHLLAAWVPKELEKTPADLISRSGEWSGFVMAGGLPRRHGPAVDLVVSANDRPPEAQIVIGHFFSSPTRRNRIFSLLQGTQRIGSRDLAELLRDVTAPPALELARLLAARARQGGRIDSRSARLLTLLDGWDGAYDADSEAAAAFEMFLFHFAGMFYARAIEAAYAASWALRDLVADDVRAADPIQIAPIARRALQRTARRLRGRRWGQLHRLRLSHALGGLPVIGRRYRYFDLPTGGGSETIMKTANGLTGRRHAVRYGSNARYIFDMSDADGAQLVLLGGQDGWFGSSSFTDQVALWRRGDYIRMPLRQETVRAEFPFVTKLTPG
jgi:penicillin amidase